MYNTTNLANPGDFKLWLSDVNLYGPLIKFNMIVH